jgi:hypothetical protein
MQNDLGADILHETIEFIPATQVHQSELDPIRAGTTIVQIQ